MTKTILITGSTDGIGLQTAKMLASMGHHILLHGRSATKLKKTEEIISKISGAGRVESYEADLSRMVNVQALAQSLTENHAHIDVVINNAGVYSAPNNRTQDGLDIRFAVNTIAPYLLTKMLLSLLGDSGRVINVSSAAQSPVNLEALRGNIQLSDGMAYAQSKLAIIMWSRQLASLNESPSIVAVNPGSMLGSKMVKEAFGVAGKDILIGAKILSRLALDNEFANLSGEYFDNDMGRFGMPHPDAINTQKSKEVVDTIVNIINDILPDTLE